MKNPGKKAYAYLRVSGKGQVEGDGFTRQEKAINDYAEVNDIEVVHIYREKGVSGTLKDRPALTELLVDLDDNDIKTVIIERIDRLARDLMIQETILDDLKKNGIQLLSVTDGDLLEDDPTRILVRQVLGAIAQYDKCMIVQKLRVARERKKKETGKCEGRKSYIESNPELITELKRLRRKPRNGKRLSLQKTLKSIQEQGFRTATGKKFTMVTLNHLIYKYVR